MAAIHSYFSALVWRKTTKHSHTQSPEIQTQEIFSVWRESAMSVGGEIPECYRKFFLWAIFARFLFISLVSQMLSSVGKMLSHWELHSRPQEWLETAERHYWQNVHSWSARASAVSGNRHWGKGWEVPLWMYNATRPFPESFYTFAAHSWCLCEATKAELQTPKQGLTVRAAWRPGVKKLRTVYGILTVMIGGVVVA